MTTRKGFQNRLQKKVALSISSWFCIPEQGMKDFEILSRASAFLVNSKPNDKFTHDHHIVTSSHVVAPWRYPKYYPDEWLQFINEKHMHYTVELRFDSGVYHLQNELLPVSYHHSTRDLAVLHLMNEDNILQIYKQSNLVALDLATEQDLIDNCQMLEFHGHDIRGPSNEEEDVRLPIPLKVTGSLSLRTKHQTFAKTSIILPDGMCGGPVTILNNSKVCGVIEGIVPQTNEDPNLRGLAEFLESKDISIFLNEIENRKVQPLLGGEALLTVSADQDPTKMSVVEAMKKHEK